MGRGLGRFQKHLLTTAAAIVEVLPWGADLIELQMFWPAPKPAPFDHANVYRALHALEARGLVWLKDASDYTVAEKCRCTHAAADHRDGSGRCRWRAPNFGRWCLCRGYHQAPKPYAHWRVGVTEAGRPLISEADVAPIAARVREWWAMGQRVLARLEATISGQVTTDCGADNTKYGQLPPRVTEPPCAICPQVAAYLTVALEPLQDHEHWALWGQRGYDMKRALEMALDLIEGDHEKETNGS
jgi:hypothetical protein